MTAPLVNVLLDRVIDTRDLVDRTLDRSARSRAVLKRMLRLAVKSGAQQIDRETFREAFVTLALIEAVGAVPEALRLSRSSTARERREVTRLGPRVRTVPALRKEDVMRREAERAGVAPAKDGEV